jgi:hypothetical protein
LNKRLVFLPLFLAMLAFFAFLRTAGAENVRAVQMLDLLGTGMCLGVALANVRVLIREKTER